LHDRRTIDGVERPARTEVQHPRRGRLHLFDEEPDARDADVERREEIEAALPGEEATTDREAARRDRVVEHAAIVARVVRPAAIVLAVDRDRDLVLDERTDLLLRSEELAAEVDVEVIDAVDAE